MDILIIIAIFYILPHIFKKITENNKGKTGFKFEDLESIKQELLKIKTNPENKAKEVRTKSKVVIEDSNEIEKLKKTEIKLVNKELSDSDKEELAVYSLDENTLITKNNINFKNKSELRKAIIMNEILGKPRAIKKI